MEGHPMMQSKKQQPATSEQAPVLLMSGPFERNPLFDSVDETKIKNADRTTTINYAMDMESYNDNRFDEPSNNQFPLATNVQLQYVPSVHEPNTNYLTGPMVIRVRPDGTPVEEDRSRPLPRDDDIEAMTMGSGYFPSLRQLAQNLQPPAMPKVSKTFVPDTSRYTNYRTISRTQQH